MPEGDTIHRAARRLHQALAGLTVTRFTSVFPHLSRIDHDTPLAGRLIERVDAAGKHLLISFSGSLVLRTHMRMHGAWHLCAPGSRWPRAGHDMRIVIETAEVHAVAFSVPDAEFVAADAVESAEAIQRLGPDVLSSGFVVADAAARLAAVGDTAVADALLDQQVVAGIGNIYKSESLFAAGINPFTPVSALDRAQLERIVDKARRLMTASVASGRLPFRVYGRAGDPCRRCGTRIEMKKQGPHARSTYWCPRCQKTEARRPGLTAACRRDRGRG